MMMVTRLSFERPQRALDLQVAGSLKAAGTPLISIAAPHEQHTRQRPCHYTKQATTMLDKLSAELLLYIFSFLDLPDLDELSKLDPALARLTADKALHNVRLRIVFPARVEHDLFALSRPTIPDLVHRGVLRGLAIERRWRAGSYLYSQSSVRQYEISQQLARQHAGHVVSQHLTRRSAAAAASGGTGSTNPLKQLYPGISHNLAHALLPVARKLKWSLRRDTLAKMVRDKSGITGVAKWLENNRLVQEGERVRLAICPPANVRKTVSIYERLSVV
ncbi:hypothetical protein HMN09_00910400 [Mycena chlorophos]|uniref:F-box domain-containing protein n=1 Tax=Mycena chlorophos TaxID=658473 RepID=A0A8H6W838_MYCCL|nr:hypothetical protein HMN09_00910400 [Mycena chlorophos]